MSYEGIARLLVVVTLCAFVISVTAAMIVGLFDPAVDNREIFKLLTPPFSMIIGAFVGYLAGKNEARRR